MRNSHLNFSFYFIKPKQFYFAFFLAQLETLRQPEILHEVSKTVLKLNDQMLKKPEEKVSLIKITGVPRIKTKILLCKIF